MPATRESGETDQTKQTEPTPVEAFLGPGGRVTGWSRVLLGDGDTTIGGCERYGKRDGGQTLAAHFLLLAVIRSSLHVTACLSNRSMQGCVTAVRS
jgi:hypothetical protein